MNVLILGVGNLLLQDEGAGGKVVEEFGRRYQLPEGVELLDGGTAGLDLLHYIRGRGCLILLDVVKSGQPPGSIVRLEGEQVPALFQKRISPHQLGISDLLAVAQLTGELPGKLVLYGIEPKSIDTGLELSEEVGGRIGEMAGLVALELALLGLEVMAR